MTEADNIYISHMHDDDWIQWGQDTAEPYHTGTLVVSEDPPHTMHYAEYGNKNGEPMFYVHGGPGAQSAPSVTRMFDLNRYRVIMYDQRGCGDSEPHVMTDPVGAMKDNTTAHLIEDIEKLRDHLGIKGRMHIQGGSWGSTLCMAYAQAHPEHVQPGGLILRGIFLLNKRDLEFFYQGNAATYDLSKPYEEQNYDVEGAYRAYRSDGPYTIREDLRAPHMRDIYDITWRKYISLIPAEERGDMITAYHKRFAAIPQTDEERDYQLECARAWSLWEGVTTCVSRDMTQEFLDKISDPPFALALARIESEYFYRSLRDQDPHLSNLMSKENLDILATLQPKILHGKYDQVCGFFNAEWLRDEMEARGLPYEFHALEGGHSLMDYEMWYKNTEVTGRAPALWAHRVAQSQEPDFSRYYPEGM